MLVNLQISDEQVIHSHTPLLTLGPSLRSKHCLIVGQGPVVDIVRQEYPLTCVVLIVVALFALHCYSAIRLSSIFIAASVRNKLIHSFNQWLIFLCYSYKLQCCNRFPVVLLKYLDTVGHKTHKILLCISSANVDRF